MSVPRTKRAVRLVRAVAAMLLVLESAAAAGVGLLHVSERIAAPAAIEAEHGKACVVVHDPASCQVVGVAALPDPYRRPFATDARGARPLAPALEPRPARLLSRATAPRAPPALSV